MVYPIYGGPLHGKSVEFSDERVLYINAKNGHYTRADGPFRRGEIGNAFYWMDGPCPYSRKATGKAKLIG